MCASARVRVQAMCKRGGRPVARSKTCDHSRRVALWITRLPVACLFFKHLEEVGVFAGEKWQKGGTYAHRNTYATSIMLTTEVTKTFVLVPQREFNLY